MKYIKVQWPETLEFMGISGCYYSCSYYDGTSCDTVVNCDMPIIFVPEDIYNKTDVK